MATTKEKDSTLVKEKKGTSPSNSLTQPRKTITKQSRPSSSERKEISTASKKPLPNYLKPTISSHLHEPSKQVKKHGPEDPTQMPSLLRRRSFDRPASASGVQNPHISMGPRERLGTRSSSFSGRTSTIPLPKPSVEKTSRIPPRSTREMPVQAKTVKSTNVASKKEANAAVTEKMTSSHNPDSRQEPPAIEKKKEDKEPINAFEDKESITANKTEREYKQPMNATEETKEEDRESITATETKKEEEKSTVHEALEEVEAAKSDGDDHADAVRKETDNDGHEEVEPAEILTVPEDRSLKQDANEVGAEGEKEVEKNDTVVLQEEDHNKDDSNDTHLEENYAGDADAKAAQDKEEEVINNPANGEEEKDSINETDDENKREDLINKTEDENKDKDSIKETEDENKAEGKADDDKEKIEPQHEQEQIISGAVEENKPEAANVATKPEGKADEDKEEIVPPQERERVNSAVEEKKPVAANVTIKRQASQGKKDSPAAYNAIIEETTSKLMEKRKNKVKALVGAFETVIDYESAK